MSFGWIPFESGTFKPISTMSSLLIYSIVLRNKCIGLSSVMTQNSIISRDSAGVLRERVFSAASGSGRESFLKESMLIDNRYQHSAVVAALETLPSHDAAAFSSTMNHNEYQDSLAPAPHSKITPSMVNKYISRRQSKTHLATEHV